MNWTQINQLVESLKNNDEETDELLADLENHVRIARKLYGAGWPEQEIVYFWGNGQDQGIPLELARIVLRVFQFCADRNIDLADALEEIAA